MDALVHEHAVVLFDQAVLPQPCMDFVHEEEQDVRRTKTWRTMGRLDAWDGDEPYEERVEGKSKWDCWRWERR